VWLILQVFLRVPASLISSAFYSGVGADSNILLNIYITQLGHQ